MTGYKRKNGSEAKQEIDENKPTEKIAKQERKTRAQNKCCSITIKSFEKREMSMGKGQKKKVKKGKEEVTLLNG